MLTGDEFPELLANAKQLYVAYGLDGWLTALSKVVTMYIVTYLACKPVAAVGRWYWRMVSAPFRKAPPPPEDPLIAGIITEISSPEAVWSACASQLQTSKVKVVTDSACSDVLSVFVGTKDVTHLFDSKQLERLFSAVDRVIQSAKERQDTMDRLLALSALENRSTEGVPLIARMLPGSLRDK